MSQIPPPDWMYEEPRRPRRGRLLRVLAVLALVGGGWWLATSSPWSEEVQSRWAASEPGIRLASLEREWSATPIGRWVERLLGLGDSGQRLARLAPANTRLYAEFSPSWWTRHLIAPSKEGPDAAAMAELRQWTREQWGLDWEQDVAPWARPEVGMLGGLSGLEGYQVDEWSFWVGSDDDAKAAACLGKLRDFKVAAGATTREGSHGKTRYDVVTPVSEPAFALAVLGGYAVIASPPRTIEGLIDQIEKGGPTLAADNPRYRRVASAWPRGAVAHAFVDGEGAKYDAGPWPRFEAAGVTLSSGADWGALEVTTAFDVEQASAADRSRWEAVVPPLDLRRFDRLPAATVLALGVTATPETRQWLSAPLAVAWAPFGGDAGGGAVFTGLLARLTSLEGPLAVGMVASPPEAGARDPVGAVLAVRPKEPEALRQELEQAARTVTSGTDLSKLPGPAGQWAALPWVQAVIPGATSLSEEKHGRETWKVIRAGGQGLAGWTTSGDDVVLAGGDQTIRLCQEARFASISAAPGFEAMRKRWPASPGLVLYGDGPNLRSLLQASPILPAKYANQAAQGLAPLRSVGFAAAPGVDRRGFHHAALTVLFDPR